MKKCYWWNRWYHRKNRTLDREILFPSIRYAAVRWADGLYLNGTSMHKQAVEVKIDQAIELHKHLPGNEHWLCECALAEFGNTNPK